MTKKSRKPKAKKKPKPLTAKSGIKETGVKIGRVLRSNDALSSAYFS